MTGKKKCIAGLTALLLLSGGSYGGYHYLQEKQAEEAQSALETIRVQRANIQSTVSATGTIRPVNSVEISSKITARLKTVLVGENDRVEAGQVVATLDGKDYETRNEQAQFKLTNVRSKYERAQYLYNIGAYTQEQLEDAKYAYDTALSSLEETGNDLAETSIIAPMSGIVVGEPKTAGTMAVQGSDNPTVIMRIADLSSKQIQAKVDETDIGSIALGQEATFTVDAFSGKTFSARVTKISKTDTGNTWDTSRSSSTSSNSVIYYYVTLDVDDPEELLLPAMTARVNIITGIKDNALTIPISTLKTDSSGAYVMVVTEDGSQEKRYVETGLYSDDQVEILSGLKEEEEIVSTFKTAASASGSKGMMPGGGHGRRMM